MKRIITCLLVLLLLPLSLSSFQPALADELRTEEITPKANVMGMLYDWKFGEIREDGSITWDSKNPINTVFAYRGQTFDLNWLLHSGKYKGLEPKLLRFAPVEKIDEKNIKYFDMQDALSQAPKENFWFLNQLIENNIFNFFSRYYDKRYNPVTYRNVRLEKNGKITYEYSGNYNVDSEINPTTAVDLVMNTEKDKNGQISGNDMLKIFWQYVGDKENFRQNFPDEYQKLMKNFQNKTFDPKKIRFYLKLQPHIANLAFKEKNDLAVVEVQGGNFPACEKVDLSVEVANYSKKTLTAPVNLYFGQKKIGTKVVTLKGGEKKRLNAVLTMPCAKMSTTFTAWINPAKKITETDYTNNKKTSPIHTLITKPTPSETCTKSFTWTEVVPHRVCSKTGCYTYYTYHTYLATLKTTYKLTDDRTSLKKSDWLLNENGKVYNWIRAGYGMKLTGDTKVTIKQISGARKAHSAYVKQPDEVTITAWQMKNKRHLNEEQKETLSLIKEGTHFKLAKNKANKALLYTNVNMKDGNHHFILDTKGASVTTKGITQELCGKENVTFKIKGDIYDDIRTS